jgi:hypothetical protein
MHSEPPGAVEQGYTKPALLYIKLLLDIRHVFGSLPVVYSSKGIAIGKDGS